MPARSSPQAALYGRDRPLPALALQGEPRPVLDVAADCEDGAPIGAEREHARMVAPLVAGTGNRRDRAGPRIHDLAHPAWRDELDVLSAHLGAIPAAALESPVQRSPAPQRPAGPAAAR